jgi:hypothetical protein
MNQTRMKFYEILTPQRWAICAITSVFGLAAFYSGTWLGTEAITARYMRVGVPRLEIGPPEFSIGHAIVTAVFFISSMIFWGLLPEFRDTKPKSVWSVLKYASYGALIALIIAAMLFGFEHYLVPGGAPAPKW